MDCVSDNTQDTRLLDNTELPIASLRPAFQNAFTTQPLIITAPTGSGKSTLVHRIVGSPNLSLGTAAGCLSLTRPLVVETPGGAVRNLSGLHSEV